MKILKTGIVLISVFVFYFIFQKQINLIINDFFPCKIPITYSVGTFAKEFGITQEEFLKEIAKAEDVWEKVVNKELFKKTENGQLKINLIYDNRQKATNTLKSIEDKVDNAKISYDNLKTEYETLKNIIDNDKKIFEEKRILFEREIKTYNSQISILNKKGKSGQTTYLELEEKRKYLENLQEELNYLGTKINKNIEEMNALATSLNQMAGNINEHVNYYNQIGENFKEFEEGTYRQIGHITQIDIYQFENKQALFQVLVHELGHALQMEHADNPNSIMYYLNEGQKTELTKEDVSELKRACKIE